MEVVDRGESVDLMEPLTLREGAPRRGEIVDRTVALASKSAGLRRALPESLLSSLATLVRAMNCYYSNLIEGHDTHPVDIERALKQDYSADPGKRDLQREARAHIALQEWIDGGGLRGCALTAEGIRAIHQRFCRDLPKELLWAEHPESDERVLVAPGRWRSRDVKVGRHFAISPGAVPRFLERFVRAYRGLGLTDSIIATACAHHRLLWIHPFPRGPVFPYWRPSPIGSGSMTGVSVPAPPARGRAASHRSSVF